MLRMSVLAATLLVALSAAGGIATAGQSGQPDRTYQKYALIREHLVSCSLDRTWHHLGTSARRRCNTYYRRYYVLWSSPGESYHYHVHCRSSRKCPRTPEGEPDD